MYQVGMSSGRTKCRCCGAKCIPHETAEFLAGYADNPLIVKRVIWFYSDTLGFGTEVASRVCLRCAQQDVDRVLKDNSWEDPRGYYELQGDEERFGRYADEQLNGPGTVLRPSHIPMGRQENRKMTAKAEKTTEAASAEARWAEARDKMLDEFPVGTFVENDTADLKGHQGEVMDVVTVHGVAYLSVRLLTYGDGRRRDEPKQKVITMRSSKAHKIEFLSPEPDKAAVAVATPVTEDTEA